MREKDGDWELYSRIKFELYSRLPEWRKNGNLQIQAMHWLKPINDKYNGRKFVFELYTIILMESNKPEKLPIWPPPWAAKAGYAIGIVTFIFFIVLVCVTFFKEIPNDAPFLINTVLALGCSMTTAFLGGDAAAKGSIPLPNWLKNPITFSVTGGIAVFVIVLLLASFLN